MLSDTQKQHAGEQRGWQGPCTPAAPSSALVRSRSAAPGARSWPVLQAGSSRSSPLLCPRSMWPLNIIPAFHRTLNSQQSGCFLDARRHVLVP